MNQTISLPAERPAETLPAVPETEHSTTALMRVTEEQQKELQPHFRHNSHKAALWQAHHMAKKHRRPFVVLKSSSLAMPEADAADG